MGDIATGTILASSTVTIYSNMVITTPNISSTSTVASVIGLFELRIVSAEIIATTSVSFATIIVSRVAVTICPLCRCYVSFRNSKFSDGSPTDILEKKSILILEIPTNPNWGVFGIGIIIFYQTRVFEIILGFRFIVIGISIKNTLIENLT